MEDSQSADKHCILFVENDPSFAFGRALKRALDLASIEHFVENTDKLPEILNELKAKSVAASVLYLDAGLVYRECPDPSYCGGIELVKHIRITPSLEPLSMLPIIVGTVDPVSYCVQRAVDNIILLSLRCEAIKLPTHLNTLDRVLRRINRFSNLEEMRKAIRPFIIFTDGVKSLRDHSFPNRAGVGKFLREFGGLGTEEPTYRRYEDEPHAETWFKKMRFLNPESFSRAAPIPNEDFQRKASNYKYIYIDDEHHRGWSNGLYTGLFGRPVNESIFDHAASSSEGDNRLLCICNPIVAEKFFQEQARALTGALTKWSKNPSRHLAEEIKEIPPYHLIFLDLRLDPADEKRAPSEFTGINILKKIRADFPDIPVIVVSASRQAISTEEVRIQRGDGFWIKDVSSGEELINTIRKCLIKSDLRELWRTTRMVEKMDKISCFEWNDNIKKFKPREIQIQKMRSFALVPEWPIIQTLLKESFQLLWDGDDLRRPTFHSDYYPFDRIIFNMGFIQEVRLKDIDKGYREKKDACLKDVPNPQDEGHLRHRRNDVAHPGRQDRLFVRAEAIAFFKFTLNRLLDDELFPKPLSGNTSCLFRDCPHYEKRV